MNTAQFISIFNSGGNPLGTFQERVEADGGTVEGLDNMLAKYDASASWQLIPSAVKAGTAYAQVPNTSLGDLTVTRASSGTFTNSAGVVQTAASNVLRTDYRNEDGTLSATGRYLLEPQRTNSIRNSSMVGAVAGSPGTAPTNWLASGIAGLSRTILGTGTENGLPYIDIRLNGTATGTNAQVQFDSLISASVGQAWTNSIYFKIVSITNAPNSYFLNITELDSSGNYLTEGNQAFTPTSTLNRYSFTRTLANASVGRVLPIIRINLTIGQSYDFTIRIAAPQMELGAYATTWVPTTTAAVTRLADAASKTGVSSLIGQTEGTMFLDFLFNDNDTSVAGIFSLSNGTTSNRIYIGRLTNRVLRSVVVSSGTTVAEIAMLTDMVVGQRYRAAIAYKENDFAFYVNGVQIGTDTSGTVPATSQIQNNSGAGASQMFNPINQAALFPTRLTNAQLAQLTTL